MNTKLQTIMEDNENVEETDVNENNDHNNEIVTTVEEMQGYYIVKSILAEYCDSKKIGYKDTFSYFGILYDNKVTKWICRIYLKDSVKFITVPSSDKKEKRYNINCVDDIYKLKDILINSLSRYEKINKKEIIHN